MVDGPDRDRIRNCANAADFQGCIKPRPCQAIRRGLQLHYGEQEGCSSQPCAFPLGCRSLDATNGSSKGIGWNKKERTGMQYRLYRVPYPLMHF